MFNKKIHPWHLVLMIHEKASKLTESCFYNSKNSTGFFLLSVWRGHWPRQVTGPVCHVLNTATALWQQSNSMNLVICPANLFYHNILNTTPTILFSCSMKTWWCCLLLSLWLKARRIQSSSNGIQLKKLPPLPYMQNHRGVLVVHVCHHSLVELLHRNKMNINNKNHFIQV